MKPLKTRLEFARSDSADGTTVQARNCRRTTASHIPPMATTVEGSEPAYMRRLGDPLIGCTRRRSPRRHSQYSPSTLMCLPDRTGARQTRACAGAGVQLAVAHAHASGPHPQGSSLMQSLCRRGLALRQDMLYSWICNMPQELREPRVDRFAGRHSSCTLRTDYLLVHELTSP